MLQNLDAALFRWINHSWSNSVLDVILPFFNGNKLFIPLLLTVFTGLIWFQRRRGAVYLLTLVLGIALVDGVLCNTLKKSIDRPRPFLTQPDVHLLAGKGGSGSMPSAHSANCWAAAAITFFFYRRSWKFMVPLASTVGLARVYSGVHYPSDVLVGALVGLAGGAATFFLISSAWRPLIQRLLPTVASRYPTFSALIQRNPPELPQNPLTNAEWYRVGLLLVFVFLAIRLVYIGSNRILLVEDEAYQWMWGKHPALSYFSKPPLIAYLHWAGRTLWGDREFGIRFFAPVLAAGLSWMMLAFFARTASARLGAALVLTTAAVPLMAVGATLMSIDALSVFFWTAAMVTGWFAIERDAFRWWAATGLMLGLGFLSKYTALFQWISFAIVFAFWPDRRRCLRSYGPWMAAGIGLFGLIPVWLWNAKNGWITLIHLNSRAGLDHHWEPTLRFFGELVGAEIGLLNPVFAVGLVLTFLIWRKDRLGITRLEQYLFWMGAPVFVGYILFSLRARVQPNWIAPSLVPLFAWMLLVWSRQSNLKIALRWWAGAIVGGLIASIVIHDTQLVKKITGIALPTKIDALNRARGWPQLAQHVETEIKKVREEGKNVFVLGDHYGTTSLLNFYITEAREGVPDERLVFFPWTDHAENQYFFWATYTNRIGNDAILVRQAKKLKEADPEAVLQKADFEVSRQFESVESLGLRSLSHDGLVIRQFELYRCKNLLPMNRWAKAESTL